MIAGNSTLVVAVISIAAIRRGHCAIKAIVASFLILPSSVTSARVRGSTRRRGGKGGDVVRRHDGADLRRRCGDGVRSGARELLCEEIRSTSLVNAEDLVP